MQKFNALICTISIIFFLSCHSSKEKQPVADAIENTSFFPVTDFLLGQLHDLDSLPVTALKITIDGNKPDSQWLKKEDIRKFASPFLRPVIDSASMANYFAGKSFMDQTINAVTFSYDPKARLPDSIKLSHCDIYIDPQKGNIQRIYLVKEEPINGGNITTQLTWKVNKWCSIRTIIQEPGKQPRVKEEIMKWDFD